MIILKFTINKIENTPYSFIDLEEHFKGIRAYLKDVPEEYFYNFELLLEDEEKVLFAIRNNYRADVYILNLNSFECEAMGSLGTENAAKGDSLAIGAVNMEKIHFEYRLTDEKNISGIYSVNDKRIIDQFETSSDWDYLYLNDRYYILSKDSFYWDEVNEEWVFNIEEDRLYLYDRDEDKSFEIFDKRLKDSYHTSSNHFIYNNKGREYILNFPFRRDPEDAEEMIKPSYIQEVLDDPKEISYMRFEDFICNIKLGKDIPLKTLYSWTDLSVLKPYFYFHYTSNSLEFSIYNLKNKTIEVFNTICDGYKFYAQLVTDASFRDLGTCLNINYIGKAIILACKDNETEILTPINKTIRHTSRETLKDFNEMGSLIDGWDEDDNGENYRDYMIVLDDKDKEKIRVNDYFLKLEHGNVLVKT